METNKVMTIVQSAVKKPPIGLRPEAIAVQVFKHERILEILSAMERFSEAGVEIPLIWSEELELRLKDV